MEFESRSIVRGAERALESQSLSGVLVRLTVGADRFLHVYLGSDGAVERGGRGEREFSGTLGSPGLFEEVLEKVSPQLLRWAGQSWSDPLLRGKTCELLIGFKEPGGRERLTRWQYGSESPEPPAELRDFVLTIVEATNPWYRRQIEIRQERAHRRPGAAWRLVPLLPSCEMKMEAAR